MDKVSRLNHAQLKEHAGSALGSSFAHILSEDKTWMGTRPAEMVWQFNDMPPGVDPSQGKVTWNFSAHDSNGVLASIERYWIDYARALTCALMDQDVIKGSSGQLYAREILAFTGYMCHERKCQSVECVTKKDIESYEAYLAAKALTVSAVETKLSLIRKMWVHRKYIGEGLVFDPYVRNGSLKKKAKRIGKLNGHTKTLKPEPYFELIENALNVIDTSDDWLELIPLYVQMSSEYAGDHLSRRFKKKTGRSSGELIENLRTIYGAAIVVVFALLGERKHELAGTTVDDVLEVIEGKSDLVTGTVYKTARTVSGKVTRRPIVNELRQAFHVVMRLTDLSRSSYEGSRLFIQLPLKSSANANPQVELTTTRIYRLMNYIVRSSGHEGRVLPHMIRRAFSMIWAWRYEVGDLHLLSKMLYHNGEFFTKFYTEDEDVWEFLPEGEQALAFNFMEEALLGKKRISGEFSKTLERYYRLLMSVVSALTPERVHGYVERLVDGDSDNLRVVAREFGYCVMSKKRGLFAKCSTDGRTPNFSKCTHATCAECKNFLVTESCKSFWDATLKSHKVVYASTDIPVLKQAAASGIDHAQNILDGFNEGGVSHGTTA